MTTVRALIEQGGTWSRELLAHMTGREDRTVRQDIRELRRAGIPVMALKDGGYRLAETDSEKRQLLNLYRHRAMDELVTLSRLAKAMQIDGQTMMAELMSGVEAGS